MYVIKETRRYYGPTTDYTFVTDPDSGDVAYFYSKGEARSRIEELEGFAYELRHNQYGYDYSILDADKPRNAAMLRI